MAHVYWIMIGAALAVAFTRVAMLTGRRGGQRILAAGLLVAALIYVGFAAVEPDPLGLVLELGGALLFGGMAVAGWHGRSTLLAAGWLLHVGWDGLLHLAGPLPAPEWYAALCIGFDIVVAGALAFRGFEPGRISSVAEARKV